jgi:hypothetical protein
MLPSQSIILHTDCNIIDHLAYYLKVTRLGSIIEGGDKVLT